MSGGVVCGFWDEAARLAGLGWQLGETAGGVVMRGDSLTPASPEIVAGDESVRLDLTAGDERVEAELTPQHDGAPANGDGNETSPCGATVRVAGQRRVIECRGYLTRWAADPLHEAGLLRHLAMPAADGGVLVVLARAKAGEGFAEEHSSALLFDAEGTASPYPHAFLSTQYDEDGRQTRAGLELWSSDEAAPPIRAAGTLLGEVAEGDGVSAAILRTSAEGTTGLGGYLIWRA
jgi:hypothetical protein